MKEEMAAEARPDWMDARRELINRIFLPAGDLSLEEVYKLHGLTKIAKPNADLDGALVPLPERLAPERAVPPFPLATYRVMVDYAEQRL